MPYSKHLASIEEIIEEARNGRMFILVDDENRENEGDLVIPAQMATPEAINFMATHGRGLICLALERERIEQLNLSLMPRYNSSRFETAFTVSIEAREGVTTGISAHDRARTVSVAIDPNKGAEGLATPGHIFPLMGRDGGVLVRTGHTEAAIDIARLASLNPSGVICEIMNDDGSMARMPDLVEFAKRHDLKIATIAELIAYRRRYDKLVHRVLETEFVSKFGTFDMIVYENTVDQTEHIVLSKGKVSADKPTLVRMHALNVLTDALGDMHKDKHNELHRSMEIIQQEGQGVIVLLREPKKNTVSELLSKRLSGKENQDTPSKETEKPIRDYGIGAQILLDLGIKKMVLLSNSRLQAVGLEGYELTVEDYKEIA